MVGALSVPTAAAWDHVCVEVTCCILRYRSVLKALPRVLVLAESRLYHLVEALSSEVAQAFQDSGLTCPPWRDVQVLLDKWLCKTPVDLTVDSDATLESLKSVMMVSIQSAQGQ